ncbi:MAG: ATP-binding protein, partial [Deltaproteobacteria bacterium]|nr:ATP-binding protein [Deltaproteobacteria bacterium]
ARAGDIGFVDITREDMQMQTDHEIDAALVGLIKAFNAKSKKVSSISSQILRNTKRVKTWHRVFNESGVHTGETHFEFSDESEGTKKIITLTMPINNALDHGHVLIIDEFDARFHPLMTRFLLKLFNSNYRNAKGAQLIFASHDPNLMRKELFRRDQIWFTQKDRLGATQLYSLSDFKKIRKDHIYYKDYLLGKYGGIPIIDTVNETGDNDHAGN